MFHPGDKIFDKYFTLKGETLNNGDGICFFNRDNELTENELDVSCITYKKPILGYIFVDYVSI